MNGWPLRLGETRGMGFPVSDDMRRLANGSLWNWGNVALDAGIWAGSAFTLGQGGRPGRLGQILPREMVDDLARAIAEAAKPGMKDIVQTERARISDALLKGLPFAGASATLLLATYFLAPDAGLLKFAGYAGAVLLFVAGTARSLALLSVPEPSP